MVGFDWALIDGSEDGDTCSLISQRQNNPLPCAQVC